MGKTLQYALYATVCIVSFIIVLICFWWFTSPYTKEDFIVAAPYVVMVGLTSTGTVYYADIDVPMSPKWINTGLTGIGDIAGSYGQLYTVPTGGGQVKYGAYGAAQTAFTSSQSFREISVDDNGMLIGCNSAVHTIVSPTASANLMAGTGAIRGSVNGGTFFEIGNDNNLYYHNDITRAGTGANPTGGGPVSQVSFDGAVCVLKTDGTLWCADMNIGAPNANWKQQGNKKFSQISLKGGRLVGVGFGTDTATYYSNTYDDPTWTTVPTQEYNTTGANLGGALRFTKVIMFYPALDARRKRFLAAGSSCNSNEQQIGNYCYQACASGRPAVGTKCPYRRKHTPAIPICPANTTYINGSCYKPCDSNHVAQGQFCMGNTVVKGVLNLESTSRASYSCTKDGSVEARYVRIRPTTLIPNNRLCISSVIVKGTSTGGGSTSGSSQQILSTNAKCYATDGTCIDTPIGGRSCGLFSSYLSGNTYNNDSDGGQLNRISKTYWELDLGKLQNIKSIEFTGCSYVPTAGSSASTVVDGSSISLPKADQITGMRLELYATSNEPTSEPIVARTLGPEMKQIITFNYVTKEPGIDSRCYDVCPRINGVQSFNGGDQKCITSTGGISSRSVTSPLPLPDPVCNIPTLPNGDIVSLPGNVITSSGSTIPNAITQWMIDPTNKLKILSCQELPNSTLTPLRATVQIPYIAGTTTPSQVVYNLSKTDGTVISNPATQFACILPSDELCKSYNTGGAQYKFNNGLCVRMDKYPPLVYGDGIVQWGQEWNT
jgi:hypothetical protein